MSIKSICNLAFQVTLLLENQDKMMCSKILFSIYTFIPLFIKNIIFIPFLWR